jgi:hypothetical protein
MMKERGNERIEFLSTNDAVKNTLIDLSFSGAAMNYPTELAKNAMVSVKIRDYAIDATVIYCQGRAEGYRVGIHFVNVPADVQKALKIMVEEFSRGVPVTFEIIEQGEKKKA